MKDYEWESAVSCKHVLKTSWRHLERQQILLWRSLQDVFKTSSTRLHQDERLLWIFLLYTVFHLTLNDICRLSTIFNCKFWKIISQLNHASVSNLIGANNQNQPRKYNSTVGKINLKEILFFKRHYKTENKYFAQSLYNSTLERIGFWLDSIQSRKSKWSRLYHIEIRSIEKLLYRQSKYLKFPPKMFLFKFTYLIQFTASEIFNEEIQFY